MNNNSSSIVFGVFIVDEETGHDLLGIYFLEGEAEAARQAYIAEASSRTSYNAEAHDRMQRFWNEVVKVERIPVGMPSKKNPFLSK